MAETLSALRYCPDLFAFRRRKTRVVPVGHVLVGGDNPIRVQSMTTTDTLDVSATAAQTLKMVEAGCEIVRITCPTPQDAEALSRIKEILLKKGCDVPLVADIHFNPAAAMGAADSADKVRINPGNFVDTKRFLSRDYTDAEYRDEILRIEERFTPLVEKLKRLKRSLRIGTNHGSLSDRIMNRYGDSPLGMVESALEFVRICEKNDYRDIILSMKASNPKVMIAAYRLLAARMAEAGMDYPFHLGVTEAGDGEDGRIKSAIGIGSLLADGIGDTIRVSLTEDPEREVPVCFALAAPYQRRPEQAPRADAPQRAHCADPYSYARRKSSFFEVGPFRVGGHELVRVFTAVPDTADAASLMRVLEARLKAAKGADPEVLVWTVRDRAGLERLRAVRKALSGETSRLAFLGRFDGPFELVRDALRGSDGPSGRPDVDLLSWSHADAGSARFLEAVKAAGVPLLAEGADARSAARLESLARERGIPALVGLDAPALDTARLLQEHRLLAAASGRAPIHLRAPRQTGAERQVLESSVLVGGLLCDGVGDSVEVQAELDVERSLELSYNLLQGAGVRITKTEFVSCPSCGRTLFDLQETTERIKRQTGHLKGVKIAIMGCIVNGPGEMADADFGYVGGAPDRINLYVGKECVKKGIPTEKADGALIDLIKEHGKWVEP